MSTIYLWNPEAPDGGIFDQMVEEDYKRNRLFSDEEVLKMIKEDDTDFCEDCGKFYDDCLCQSPCCSAPIENHDLCSQCKEHI
jgi:hypothetical protein